MDSYNPLCTGGGGKENKGKEQCYNSARTVQPWEVQFGKINLWMENKRARFVI